MPEHLMGVAEIAELLGVTRQRVNQLAHHAAGFPQPVARLAAGHIWDGVEIESWARESGRLDE